MIINGEVRDLKLKGKKFRNEGKAIGIIERLTGESLPISFRRSEMEKYLGRYGNKDITLNINGEKINARFIEVQKNVLFHFPHHIEFKEI